MYTVRLVTDRSYFFTLYIRYTDGKRSFRKWKSILQTESIHITMFIPIKMGGTGFITLQQWYVYPSSPIIEYIRFFTYVTVFCSSRRRGFSTTKRNIWVLIVIWQDPLEGLCWLLLVDTESSMVFHILRHECPQFYTLFWWKLLGGCNAFYDCMFNRSFLMS